MALPPAAAWSNRRSAKEHGRRDHMPARVHPSRARGTLLELQRWRPTRGAPPRSQRRDEGMLNSLGWMKDCAQVRRWQRIARESELARAKWRSELASDVAAVLPLAHHGLLHREMLAAAGHRD
eukprot:9423278-Pyramimonas_sp.AAC.1